MMRERGEEHKEKSRVKRQRIVKREGGNDRGAMTGCGGEKTGSRRGSIVKVNIGLTRSNLSTSTLPSSLSK